MLFPLGLHAKTILCKCTVVPYLEILKNQSILVIKKFFTIVIILMFILCKITHLIK